MSTATTAQQRAFMPSGTNTVLDRRSLKKGNEHIISFLKEGMRVLDVGCGSGSITTGIAECVGVSGKVVGIDANDELITQAKEKFSDARNLSFECINFFDYQTTERFDVVTSARTLQWLDNPADAVMKMKNLVKPGGLIFVLDYNHEKIEWNPAPLEGMKYFYEKFLVWRKDAGMNNRIGDDLAGIFETIGLKNISVTDASELCTDEENDFQEATGIWIKVAQTRGVQMVRDGYITENERMEAIQDYAYWIAKEGKSMKMYLRGVSGYNE